MGSNQYKYLTRDDEYVGIYTLVNLDDVGLPIIINCSYRGTGNISQDIPLAKSVTGVVIFFITLPLILFQFRWLHIGTLGGALSGALLMVAAKVLSQNEFYKTIGRPEHLSVLFMAIGMLILLQYIEREQLLVKLLRSVLASNQNFWKYLSMICFVTFILSALFSADATCAIMTPVILKVWQSHERSASELPIVLIGIITSANIGSVITYFGNVHLALIASKTKNLASSQLTMRACAVFLLLPACLCFVFNTLLLLLYHKLKSWPRHTVNGTPTSRSSGVNRQTIPLTNSHYRSYSETVNAVGDYNFMMDAVDYRSPCQLETIHEDQILEIVDQLHAADGEEEDIDVPQRESVSTELNTDDAHYRPSALSRSGENNMLNNAGSGEVTTDEDNYGVEICRKLQVYRSISAFSAAEFLSKDAGFQQLSTDGDFQPADNKAFHVLLLLLVLFVLVCLFISDSSIYTFDPGLISMFAAVIALLADVVLCHRHAYTIINRCSWSIILLFFAFFTWLQGFVATGIPALLWANFGFNHSFDSLRAIGQLLLFTLIGSYLLGSFPLVYIVLSQLSPCGGELSTVLYITWATCIFSNLILHGSVAGLVTMQKSKQAVSYRLPFWVYFVFAAPTTAIFSVLGCLIIYGLLQLYPDLDNLR